jgi:hypothetical protein
VLLHPGGYGLAHSAFTGFLAILVVEPFVVLLIGYLLVTLFRRRNGHSFAALGLLAILGPMAMAYSVGAIDTSLRYIVAAVLFAVVAAGVCLSALDRGTRVEVQTATRVSASVKRPVRALQLVAVLFALAAAFPTSAWALMNPSINDALQVVALRRAAAPSRLDSQRSVTWDRMDLERTIATNLDKLSLPAGTVLVDDFLGFPIVLSSNSPKQFVITSDRDFKQILSDPIAAQVRFILIPDPRNGIAALDAVNRTYPGLYDESAALCASVELFKNANGDLDWKLCRVRNES